MLHLAHDEDYVASFLGGSLSGEQQRRIGFNSTVNENVLINRTLWEVSGVHCHMSNVRMDHDLCAHSVVFGTPWII